MERRNFLKLLGITPLILTNFNSREEINLIGKRLDELTKEEQVAMYNKL